MTKLMHHTMASLAATAISVICVTIAHAQGQMNQTAPFQIVEATIDDIHAAFKSGKLTARQLVQGYLDRINAFDKAGPHINSIITITSRALAEADRLDAAYNPPDLARPLPGLQGLRTDYL